MFNAILVSRSWKMLTIELCCVLAQMKKQKPMRQKLAQWHKEDGVGTTVQDQLSMNQNVQGVSILIIGSPETGS